MTAATVSTLDATRDERRAACSVCQTGVVLARSMCQHCYDRARRSGQFVPRTRDVNARLDARYVLDSETGCWLWQGNKTPDGYGFLSVQGKPRLTHRLMYERHVGAIPVGLQLDHLCRVRHCCNPAHLEPVTGRENTLRGETAPALNVTKTQCPQGHAYDDTNTRVRDGKRHCRKCDRARRQKPGLPTCERCGVRVVPSSRGTGWSHVANRATSGSSCGQKPLVLEVAK